MTIRHGNQLVCTSGTELHKQRPICVLPFIATRMTGNVRLLFVFSICHAAGLADSQVRGTVMER